MKPKCILNLCGLLVTAALPLLAASGLRAAELRQEVAATVSAELEDLAKLYRHLHANPELSFQEANTANRIAAELSQLGLEVTQNVGGHGLVGVLKNGDGPTLLIRTDLDALPVKEQTGLSYASSVTATDDAGNVVPVMHACGHDIHMTSLVGTARVLSKLKDSWRGTIVFIGQPAEERGAGARAMLGDGLFERFPVPDYGLALHVNSELPAGQVAYTPGYAMANVDSVDITIRGVGGHGAYPHTTKDPVVLAAETVLALQTIVSREIAPIEPAVVTVGSIHGGTKHNIIPDEVKLQLTLRSYSDEVREQIIDAIRRKTHGLAIAAGVPSDRLPTVGVNDEYTPAVHNDPELTQRLAGVFRKWLGEENVVERKPVMGGEDFGRYGRTEHKIPICMFFVGGVKQEKYDASRESGESLPSLHSPLFAPDPEPTIRTAVTAMSAAALELLNEKE